MDVIQVIGLDLHNLSKTIVWNGNHVPFKSHDYFNDAQLHESLAEAMDECPFDSINDFFLWKSLFKGISHKLFKVPCMNKWIYTMLLLSKNIYRALSNPNSDRYCSDILNCSAES
jgi:hypothetical protein